MAQDGEALEDTGMRNPDQVAFYHTAAWKKCRDTYAASVGNICERCASRGIIRPGYLVHPRTYLDADNINNPSILLSWDNLELLCLDCHNQEHYGDDTARRYQVDADGKIIIKPGSP